MLKKSLFNFLLAVFLSGCVTVPKQTGELTVMLGNQIVESKITLDPVISFLVRTWPAMINECTFCIDIAKAGALYKHMSIEKLEALPTYRTSPLFSERERAALAYVEEATRHKRVSDATFAELHRHFNEREIVEITWLNALENYYNLLNLPLGIESDGLCAIAQRRAS